MISETNIMFVILGKPALSQFFTVRTVKEKCQLICCSLKIMLTVN